MMILDSGLLFGPPVYCKPEIFAGPLFNDLGNFATITQREYSA